MATILFTWELGSGYGHLMLMSSIAGALRKDGHRVMVASKDVLSAHKVFAGTGIELIPTPRSQTPVKFSKQQTFAHLLANVGFGDLRHLESHGGTWKTLYNLVRPDLVIFVHSPVALLAARGLPFRKVLIGSGFFVPPNAYPLPPFRAGQSLDWNQIKSIEDGLFRNANSLLQSWHQPPLQHLAQLYAQVDQVYLTSYRELEHYPNREPEARYWGTINDGDVGGNEPVWPKLPGRKIYAYLKPFPSLPRLLQVISESSQPSLIYMSVIDPALRDRFTSPTMHIETNRLNMARVAAQCDLAITHATLGTSATLLREAKPLLLLPITEEQGVVARAIEQQGAGISASLDQPNLFGPKLKQLLEDQSFAAAAARLAERLRQTDLQESQREIVQGMLSLL